MTRYFVRVLVGKARSGGAGPCPFPKPPPAIAPRAERAVSIKMPGHDRISDRPRERAMHRRRQSGARGSGVSGCTPPRCCWRGRGRAPQDGALTSIKVEPSGGGVVPPPPCRGGGAGDTCLGWRSDLRWAPSKRVVAARATGAPILITALSQQFWQSQGARAWRGGGIHKKIAPTPPSLSPAAHRHPATGKVRQARGLSAGDFSRR